jgi:hypothetical protein
MLTQRTRLKQRGRLPRLIGGSRPRRASGKTWRRSGLSRVQLGGKSVRNLRPRLCRKGCWAGPSADLRQGAVTDRNIFPDTSLEVVVDFETSEPMSHLRKGF